MKDFIMATLGGLGVSFLCSGPMLIVLIMLIKENKKGDNK